MFRVVSSHVMPCPSKTRFLVLSSESRGVHLLEPSWHLHGWRGGGLKAWHAPRGVVSEGSWGGRGGSHEARVHSGSETHLGGRELGGWRGLLLLLWLLGLLRLPVEEEVDHDVPRVLGSHGASHLQHHPAQDVVQDSDRVLSLVVRRNSNVDVLQGRVGVAESNGGQVAVRSLPGGLDVGPWIGNDQKPWLLVLIGDLVGEGSWGVPSREGLAAGVLGELENSALSVRPSGQHSNVLRVLDRANHPRGHLKLLPGLPQVENVQTVVPPPVHVPLHLVVAVLRAEVARRSEHHLNIGFLLRQCHDFPFFFFL
mmetsp:Transcript_3480/g.12667  ORF Transcript_3480/g.12667 Transcript_3480/m.12667 type:complete len:311 (+) Transcript_3480:166-1098(+)